MITIWENGGVTWDHEKDKRGEPRVMLSWEEPPEKNRHGTQFGAHAVNLPIISKLSVKDDGRDLCLHDNDRERIKSPVTTFVYP